MGRVSCGVLLCLTAIVIGRATFLIAQAPTPSAVPAAAAAPPALDDLEKSWVQIANLSEQLAFSECQRLPSVQQFNATLAEVLQKIEARHPGFTVDRAKGALVPKPKP